MKLNFKIFKKGKPIYWVIGAVVLFVIFYFVASRGSSNSTGGVTTIQTGPSEAMQAAQLQYNAQIASANVAAQMQANQNLTDFRIAELAASNEASNIQASADVAKYVASLDAASTAKALETQQNIYDLQGQYSLETARTAAQAQLGLAELQASMFNKQLETNAQMFGDQLRAATAQTALSVIPTLKKGDRDAALISITTGQPSSHGSIIGQAGYSGLLN